MNPQDNILNLLITSMEEAIEHKKKLEPDKPISEQFDDVFDEYKFFIGTFHFELEGDHWIPEALAELEERVP